MGPFSATESIVKQTLTEWLEASSEVVVELYVPHSGSSGDFYVLNSFAQFEDLILKARPTAVAFVLRDPQFSVRGLVNNELIAQSFEEVADGEYYLIVEPSAFPRRLSPLGDGNTHVELRNDLERLRGQEVWLGRDLEMPDFYWKEDSSQDALIVCRPKETM